MTIHALIIAASSTEYLKPLVNDRPAPMLKVVDKHTIQHIIESLAYQGIKDFEIVLSYLPEQIESHLGEGKRWGVNIRYHLTNNPDFPFQTLYPTLVKLGSQPLLIGRGDVLPDLQVDGLIKKYQSSQKPLFLCDSRKGWLGWGIVSASDLASLPKNASQEAIFTALPSEKREIENASSLLSLRSVEELQISNLKMISSDETRLQFPTSSSKVESRLWIARAVSLDPTAKIVPPVYIGENCKIMANSQVGPNTILENNCVVDSKSIIENSLVCQKSYIGKGLVVKNSIIDRNTIINLEHQTRLTIGEDFIIGEMFLPSALKSVLRILSRTFALFLFTVSLPFLILFYFIYSIKKISIVQLPALSDPQLWKICDLYIFDTGSVSKETVPHGLINRLPLLINLIKGEIHFTGVPPRSIEEIKALPEDWRNLYLTSQAGLITLASVELNEDATQEEIQTTEAFYIAQPGFFNHVNLLLRWITKKVSFWN